MQNGLRDMLRHLRRLCETEAARDLGDSELLERFVTSREESAFAILVQRHGPMVLSVCRRVLKNQHAAEDAFQATFLVLVRKSHSVRKRSSLGSWLHGVAQRIAAPALGRAKANFESLGSARTEPDRRAAIRPLIRRADRVDAGRSGPSVHSSA